MGKIKIDEVYSANIDLFKVINRNSRKLYTIRLIKKYKIDEEQAQKNINIIQNRSENISYVQVKQKKGTKFS